MSKAIWFLLCMAPLAAQSEAVFPWVPNNANFSSRLIINNLNLEAAEVILVAARNGGQSEGVIHSIGPMGQWVVNVNDAFPSLGEGPGSAVIMSADKAGVEGAFIVTSSASASGSSPAQSDVLSPDAAGANLLFNYLPVSDSGSSAPVVVNMGATDATITFHAYQDGVEVAVSSAATLAPGEPFADVTTNLFPGISGDTYVVAVSDQPLVGTAFIFNEFGEPSMSNAVAVPGLPTAN